MYLRFLTLLLAAGLSTTFAQTPPNAMLDGAKVPAAAAPQAPRPQLSPEMRGDIFMARKMYREAIETFREGSPKDPCS